MFCLQHQSIHSCFVTSMVPAKVSKCWMGRSQSKPGVLKIIDTKVARTWELKAEWPIIESLGRKQTGLFEVAKVNKVKSIEPPNQNTSGALRCLSPANTQACCRSFIDLGCRTVGEGWNGKSRSTLSSLFWVSAFKIFLGWLPLPMATPRQNKLGLEWKRGNTECLGCEMAHWMVF